MDRFEDVKVRVKDATDIVRLIESYVPLKPRGRTLVALCPFHQEKSPSFTVYPENHSYYCFGCKKAGDAFSFLMEREGLSFREALDILAERAGISTDGIYGRGGDAPPRVDAGGILGQVREFFASCLAAPEGEAARGYLQRRGLASAVAGFGLGFHPAAPGRLAAFARERKLPADVLAQAGLLRDGHFEPYRGRLMFPIEDERGRVVGFGGRVLDDSKPKYVNSPESPFFNKRKILFGLRHAKQKGVRRLVVVEGYTDVIACHLAGFDGAVAALGTSLTAEHARALVRYATEGVVLLFDGDRAGRQAAERAFQELVTTDLEVRIALMPEGSDPADAIAPRPDLDAEALSAGRERFRALIEQAEDALTMWFRLLRQRLDFGLDVDVKKAVDECGAVLERVGHPARVAILLGRMAGHLGLQPEDLRRSLRPRESAQRARRPDSAPAAAPIAAAPPSPLHELELTLLSCLLARPDLVPGLAELTLQHPPVAELVERIRNLVAGGVSDPAGVVSRLFTACAERPDLASLLGERQARSVGIRDPAVSLSELCKQHRAFVSRTLAQRTRLRIREAQAKGDQALVDELTRLYQEQLRQS